MWWLLAREVLCLRGKISREQKWEVMCDLFFYREPEEAEKDEAAAKEAVVPVKETAPYLGDEPLQEVTEWADEPEVAPVVASTTAPVVEEWSEEAAPTASWGGTGTF